MPGLLVCQLRPPGSRELSMPWKSSKTNSHKLQQDETDLRSMTVLRYHTFLPERRVRKSVSHHGTLWHHTEPRAAAHTDAGTAFTSPTDICPDTLGQPAHGRTGDMTVPSSHRSTMVSILQSYSVHGLRRTRRSVCFSAQPWTDSQEAWPFGSAPKLSDFSHLMPQVSGQKTQLIQGHMWQTGQPVMAGQERAGSAL